MADKNVKRGHGPRCVAIVGPQGSGKTTLLESLLWVTGAIGRKASALIKYPEDVQQTLDYLSSAKRMLGIKPVPGSGGRPSAACWKGWKSLARSASLMLVIGTVGQIRMALRFVMPVPPRSGTPGRPAAPCRRPKKPRLKRVKSCCRFVPQASSRLWLPSLADCLFAALHRPKRGHRKPPFAVSPRNPGRTVSPAVHYGRAPTESR